MDNLAALRRARESSQRIWTANKSNLSFPELRGDYRTFELCNKSEDVECDVMESSTASMTSRFGDMMPFSVCRMDIQNAYAVALSAEVYGLLSWLNVTVEQLSKVGTSLQHPDHRERLNKVLAMTMIEISRVDFIKRLQFYQHLLREARHYLDHCNSEFIENAEPGQRNKECVESEYETLHDKGVRSCLNSLGGADARQDPLFARLDYVGATGTRNCCRVSFTQRHLERIENLWNLVRVQLQILSVQLHGHRGIFGKAETLYAQALSGHCKSTDLSHCEHSRPVAMAYYRKKGSSVSDSCDSGFDRGTGSLYDGSTLSVKDDGYYSKSAGSEVTCIHEDENASAEVESLLQGLNFKSKNLELTGGHNTESQSDVTPTSANHKFAGRECEEKHWDAVYERLERFSQATLSLLSWAEEIKDIREDEGEGGETYFYESLKERLRQSTAHAKRLYWEVKEEADQLADILPSEGETIASVVERLEIECSGLEIFDHEVYVKKSKPRTTPMSGKEMASTDRFRSHPLTSTPKPNATSLVSSPSVSYGLTNVSRRVWLDFIDEYNNALGWICQMERYTDAGDKGDFTDLELELWHKAHLKEIGDNLEKRERVKAKADYVCRLCPEFKHDARIRSAEIQMLWESLENKIRMKMVDNSYGRTLRKLHNGWSGSSSFGSSTLRKDDWSVSPKTAGPSRSIVPLEDHSFNQIRDKLGFDNHGFRNAISPEKLERNQFLMEKSANPKTWQEAEVSARWAVSVATGSDFASSVDAENPRRPSNFDKDFSPAWSKDVGHVAALLSAENSPHSPVDIDEKLLAEIAETDWDLELSDVDIGDLEVDGADWSQFTADPLLLSNQIAQFCAWLSYEEKVAFAVTSNKGLGWFPRQLKETRLNNQEQQVRLTNRRKDLNEILAGANVVVSAESVGKTINVLSLQWSCVMLHQRFLILILYCADIDCIVDRRIDVLSKNCDMDRVLAHPPDGVWSDKGEPEAVCGETNEADYNILHDVA